MATYGSVDITSLLDTLELGSQNIPVTAVDLTTQLDALYLGSQNVPVTAVDLTNQLDGIDLGSQNIPVSSVDITNQFDTIDSAPDAPQDVTLLPIFVAEPVVDPATILFNEGDFEPTLPVASFIPSVISGNVPLTVNFINTSTGAITERRWYFGDGATSTEENPSHKYVSAGAYTVYLRVFEGPYYSQAFFTVNVTAWRMKFL